VVLRDGKTLIGFLRSIDQFGEAVSLDLIIIIAFSRISVLWRTLHYSVQHVVNIAVAKDTEFELNWIWTSNNSMRCFIVTGTHSCRWQNSANLRHFWTKISINVAEIVCVKFT